MKPRVCAASPSPRAAKPAPRNSLRVVMSASEILNNCAELSQAKLAEMPHARRFRPAESVRLAGMIGANGVFHAQNRSAWADSKWTFATLGGVDQTNARGGVGLGGEPGPVRRGNGWWAHEDVLHGLIFFWWPLQSCARTRARTALLNLRQPGPKIHASYSLARSKCG